MTIDIKTTLTEAVGKIDGIDEATQGALADQLSDLTHALAESIAIEKVASIKEEQDQALAELSTQVEGQLEEQFSSALSEAATQFMADNAAKFEAALKVDLAESFLTGLSDLFKKHAVLIHPDIAAVQEQFQSREDQYIAEIERLEAVEEELNTKVYESQKAAVVEAAVAGLTELQKDRVVKLAESLATADINVFKSCITNVVEGMGKERASGGSVHENGSGEDVGGGSGAVGVNESDDIRQAAALLLR